MSAMTEHLEKPAHLQHPERNYKALVDSPCDIHALLGRPTEVDYIGPPGHC